MNENSYWVIILLENLTVENVDFIINFYIVTIVFVHGTFENVLFSVYFFFWLKYFFYTYKVVYFTEKLVRILGLHNFTVQLDLVWFCFLILMVKKVC